MLTSYACWAQFQEGIDRELAHRLCQLADSAAASYCGIVSIESLDKATFLPWLMDWHRQYTRGKSEQLCIALKENIKDKFLDEIEDSWKRYKRQSETCETADLLGAYFKTDPTANRKESIQTLAVLSLYSVNEGLKYLRNFQYEDLALSLSDAYRCLAFIRADSEAFTSGRSRGGKARHLKDPKSKDKNFVHECWRAWVLDPGRYETLAEFSRDMVGKTEHLAGDPQVIGRWVREWRKEIPTE